MSLVDRILDELGLGPDGFEPPDPAADQAVIDLLSLVMLVDGTSSAAERERIQFHLDDQDWPEGANPYRYYEESTPRIRAALEDEGKLESLLSSVTERLRSDDDRDFALALMRELAGLDGTIDDREEALLAGLRTRFGQAG